MPRFSPFRGLRYAAESESLDVLIAPPYDVVSAEDRAQLVDRSEHNAIRLELPDSYDDAARLLAEWQRDGVLIVDETPSFYVYRMTFPAEGEGGRGRTRSTTGVLGALAIGDDVLAHEHTTPKDKADRSSLLAATRANLSPIWALTPAPGLSSMLAMTTAPDAVAVEPGDVVHELWCVTDAPQIDAIAGLVASQPALIADGHHRYEVATEFGSDALLAYVVELADDQLAVRAIHRLVRGLPDGFDLVGAMGSHFDVSELASVASELGATDEGLTLVTREGVWLLRPTDATARAAAHDLDSSRLDVALSSLPPHELVFQHGIDLARAAVEKGDAQAAVLLRPATVDQIAAIASGGDRMPPKTTFFYPKLATGMVFRSLDL